MPTYTCKPRWAAAKENPDPVTKYRLPYNFIGDEAASRVAEHRAFWARHRDEMIGYQKACAASGDRDGARFFKDEAREALKHYRAACLLLPWVAAEYPGDCKLDEPYSFPEELFAVLDTVACCRVPR